MYGLLFPRVHSARWPHRLFRLGHQTLNLENGVRTSVGPLMPRRRVTIEKKAESISVREIARAIREWETRPENMKESPIIFKSTLEPTDVIKISNVKIMLDGPTQVYPGVITHNGDSLVIFIHRGL